MPKITSAGLETPARIKIAGLGLWLPEEYAQANLEYLGCSVEGGPDVKRAG
jgi:hypothetical protein